jgi:hypothetical protein
MNETPTVTRSLRRIAALAAAGCAALAATAVAARRGMLGRSRGGQDPPDSALTVEAMESLATGEGMPEAHED